MKNDSKFSNPIFWSFACKAPQYAAAAVVVVFTIFLFMTTRQIINQPNKNTSAEKGHTHKKMKHINHFSSSLKNNPKYDNLIAIIFYERFIQFNSLWKNMAAIHNKMVNWFFCKMKASKSAIIDTVINELFVGVSHFFFIHSILNCIRYKFLNCFNPILDKTFNCFDLLNQQCQISNSNILCTVIIKICIDSCRRGRGSYLFHWIK